MCQKKELQSKWENILKKEGLYLVQKNNRTARFEHREQIRDFFLTLDCLLSHHPSLNKFDKQVLTKYSSGISVVQITKELKVSRNRVNNVIERYKGIVIAIQNMKLEVQSAL
jgi:transposase-like protein